MAVSVIQIHSASLAYTEHSRESAILFLFTSINFQIWRHWTEREATHAHLPYLETVSASIFGITRSRSCLFCLSVQRVHSTEESEEGVQDTQDEQASGDRRMKNHRFSSVLCRARNEHGLRR
ncbi:hypothetical protein R1flu_001200 [Riccia fluitans]|uniref:Uncharacterized protein n=1 Tax=Riccia fluitans TaxID=41844 RepID=A0ABD1Y2N7_9MARC